MDEATPQQAIALFGEPRLDRQSDLSMYEIQKLLSADTAKRNFKTLEWENVKGYKDVMLTFSSDDKLLLVFATPLDEAADSVETLCHGNWKPVVKDLASAFASEMSSPSAATSQEPLTRVVYNLFSLSPSTFCFASISNEHRASTEKSAQPVRFPGKVMIVVLVSRSVERKATKTSTPVRRKS